MAHAPSALVGDAQLPLYLLGRNAVARAGHQVHGEEPLGQVGPGLVKDRPGRRVNVMAAVLTGIGPALGHGMERRSLFTPRTYDVRSARSEEHTSELQS